MERIWKETLAPAYESSICKRILQHIVNANEACQLLGCSRQNIDDLMKRDKLHPIRKDAKYKLFLKSEIMQRRKQQ